MDLAVEVYEATRAMPVEERFGLTGQIRRAATSVPANIAEGSGRQHPGDFAQFLSIAMGSLKELETHLLLANRLGMLSEVESLLALVQRVGMMLTKLRQSAQARKNPPR